ncbi:SAM-dependent methyltransferase [Streptomyces sp. BE20]|uniref:class I SAM-dependent methyltransferase n=1 Tax=unclassified Streptomyces TaxID=2593676 RepID=UPI002E79A8D8|nr:MULTISPECIES: SAM-dependent methyltransferase [unclassified Streptomyces]MED7947392.1 SAM-dependent methyltransferase [Streptomyces sp. BE303]MEE1820785.1 SAM-dependent methyltransferase [Streptomyces sp. BE20]
MINETRSVMSTSNWTAALRMAEQRCADPYLVDPFAALLCSPGDLAEIGGQAGAPVTSVVLRGRLGDEVVRRAVAQGVRQVVILGAGSDTRAYRLDLPEAADVTCFEVDLPGQVPARDAALRAHGARPAMRQTVVEADLCTPGWPDALRAAGWDPDRASVWLLEGLLYYLPPERCDALLGTLSKLSAPGSAIALDVAHTSFFEAAESRDYLDFLTARRSPYLTGIADAHGWLAGFGWKTRAFQCDQLDLCDLVPPPPARLLTCPHIWFATGTR